MTDQKRTRKPKKPGQSRFRPQTIEDVKAVYERNRRSEALFRKIFPGAESAEPVDEPMPALHEILGEHLPADVGAARRYWREAPEEKRAAIMHHAANCTECFKVFLALADRTDEG